MVCATDASPYCKCLCGQYVRKKQRGSGGRGNCGREGRRGGQTGHSFMWQVERKTSALIVKLEEISQVSASAVQISCG